MRTPLLLLISLGLALPIQAQSQNKTFVAFSEQLNASVETVEKVATILASEEKYLREIDPAADPTVLVAGNMHLCIGDIPFTLYLRSVNNQTEVRLESQKLGVSRQVKQKAKRYLQIMVFRATSDERPNS